MVSFDTPPDQHLTPAQLGITEAEHRWLRAAATTLRTMLPDSVIDIPGDGRFAFDMRYITRQLGTHDPSISEGPIPGTYSCGTAGCIAGLMHILSWAAGAPLWQSTGDIDPIELDELIVSRPLVPLFWPYGRDIIYAAITPAVAADAVEHFLSTGEVRFDSGATEVD